MTNPFESGGEARRPTHQEISARANKLLNHTEHTAEMDAEAWGAHLEAVIDDLYALSLGADPHGEMYQGIPKSYPGYTPEDFASLLETLAYASPDVARRLQVLVSGNA